MHGNEKSYSTMPIFCINRSPLFRLRLYSAGWRKLRFWSTRSSFYKMPRTGTEIKLKVEEDGNVPSKMAFRSACREQRSSWDLKGKERGWEQHWMPLSLLVWLDLSPCAWMLQPVPQALEPWSRHPLTCRWWHRPPCTDSGLLLKWEIWLFPEELNFKRASQTASHRGGLGHEYRTRTWENEHLLTVYAAAWMQHTLYLITHFLDVVEIDPCHSVNTVNILNDAI